MKGIRSVQILVGWLSRFEQRFFQAAQETKAPPQKGWGWHYALLLLVSLAVGVVFIQEPGFGDELSYWSLAFDLHEVGRKAWSLSSYHDLRWPVWGVSWLWQRVFGAGLASFYCVPIFYLLVGALLVFSFGRRVLNSVAGSWAGALALLFAPVLDAVISRPMPDLSEGIFGAGALLAWWLMMEAKTPARGLAYGILSGLSIGLAFSNRITGIFIVPVLIVVTLVFFPRRFLWLLVPGLLAAVFFVLEGVVYHQVCGDWLHSIHANLSGTGAKDVVVMPLWRLPFRYLDGFLHGNRLAPIYALCTVIGGWTAWRQGGRPGRLVVLWFGVLYLEYSCAVQSLHPVRPLIGSTFRYLGTLALPMSLLAGFGALMVGKFLLSTNWVRVRQWDLRITRHPLICGFALVVMLTLYSSRSLFDLGFTGDLRRYMARLPAGTRVFSHHAMRDIAFLVAPEIARGFVWVVPRRILGRNEEVEKLAASCDQFWYLRKHLWLNERKELERRQPGTAPKLGSYLENPEHDWVLAEVLAKTDLPDLVLSRRRLATDKPPQIIDGNSPEFQQLFGQLPLNWKTNPNHKTIETAWAVPASLRGKLVTLQFVAASNTVEPLNAYLHFTASGAAQADYVLRPILYQAGGKEFFAFRIPERADRCEIQLLFTKKARDLQLTGFRAVYED